MTSSISSKAVIYVENIKLNKQRDKEGNNKSQMDKWTKLVIEQVFSNYHKESENEKNISNTNHEIEPDLYLK